MNNENETSKAQKLLTTLVGPAGSLRNNCARQAAIAVLVAMATYLTGVLAAPQLTFDRAVLMAAVIGAAQAVVRAVVPLITAAALAVANKLQK